MPIDAKSSKEKAFRFIANSDKIKKVLEIIDIISQQGKGQIRIEYNMYKFSYEEILYLEEKKGFRVDRYPVDKYTKISWV